jgi:hypothetical protein
VVRRLSAALPDPAARGLPVSTEQRAERPTLVPQSEFDAIAKVLPEGAVLLGGVKASYEVAEDAPGPCVIIVFALNDHTIHHAEVCGSGTHYEITSDVVVGHW